MNGKIYKSKYNFLRSIAGKVRGNQVTRFKGKTLDQTTQINNRLMESKFSGTTYKYVNDTPMRGTQRWTRHELGLEDRGGMTTNAPVLSILSFGKGPGPDGVVDTLLLEDDNFREDIFNKVYDIFNNGQSIDQQLLEGKLMLLSKTNEANPDIGNTRPIVILNTTLKVV